MAHLQPLDYIRCFDCKAPARWKLFSEHCKDIIGHYCDECSKQPLDEAQAWEDTRPKEAIHAEL